MDLKMYGQYGGSHNGILWLSASFCTNELETSISPCLNSQASEISFNLSHAAIKISINATAAGIICKNIFPTPVQVKNIIKNKIGDIQQKYLYQNVCK